MQAPNPLPTGSKQPIMQAVKKVLRETQGLGLRVHQTKVPGIALNWSCRTDVMGYGIWVRPFHPPTLVLHSRPDDDEFGDHS